MAWKKKRASAASECIISSDSNSKIDWIQCDSCDRWLHTICVGEEEDPSEIDHRVCYSCK